MRKEQHKEDVVIVLALLGTYILNLTGKPIYEVDIGTRGQEFWLPPAEKNLKSIYKCQLCPT